jgi:hypothetical protein
MIDPISVSIDSLHLAHVGMTFDVGAGGPTAIPNPGVDDA